MAAQPFVGTAGWAIPREFAPEFPPDGSQLERFSRRLGCAEINSSFYRSHQRTTYERWAAQTPKAFRFSVKLPRTVTHEGRLRRARPTLQRFLDEVGGLGERLGVLLVQLPPSLALEVRPVRSFFALLASLYPGMVACEPRHPSWFTSKAERELVNAGICRVGADPARIVAAASPGGASGLRYWRWHGSPKTYWSRYESSWLAARALEVAAAPQVETWCIFDNTASGSAAGNALELQALIKSRPS